MAAAPVWLQRTLTWIAPVLLVGLLLFPSTCADAAGVHSLFDDPLAAHTMPGHHPAIARYATQYGMTIAELEQHVAMGHIVLPADAFMPQRPTPRSTSPTTSHVRAHRSSGTCHRP